MTRYVFRRFAHARITVRAVLLVLLIVAADCQLPTANSASAATTFASPAFTLQWERGEATVQNFWGPLPNATGTLYEEYRQSAPTGQRVVQYFDKGRMEINTPGGPVTNGLLTNELITGRVQVGDAQFVQREPARIPVAGDPENAFPTYADLRFFQSTPAQAPKAVTILAGPGNGVPFGVITSPYQQGGTDPNASIVGFDPLTRHYVPRAFADFRNRVGLLTVGYAVTEPFYATLKVGGVSKVVMIQAFERRVLTYTPANTPAFLVEFGNIGQHYYQYRHPRGGSENPPPLVPQPVPPIFQPVGP